MNETNDTTRPGRQLLDEIIAREEVAEARVRRVAVLAWSITFATIPLGGIVFFLVRVLDGASVEALRAALLVVVTTGILALFLAVLMTVAWLFRSRAPTLTAIERRLAALESMILARSDAGRRESPL